MKILFLDSPRSDYMQDVLFSGIVKTIGIDNIKTVPFNKSYALQMRKYPKNLGYTQGITTKYLLSYLKPFKYDLVIVASAKKDPFEQYIKIAKQIPKSVPVVFIDGGDVDWVGGDMKRKGCYDLYEKAISIRNFDLVFKREMIIGKQYNANVIPCPFAFNLDRIKKINPTQKKYDVSFWAVESAPIRTQALTLIQDKYDCKSNGTSLNQSFKEYNRRGLFYLEELQACKVVLNFRGGGWDTLRYWEVPALGTFMISQKPQIVIPNEFEHKQNIVYCKDDLSDLTELIDYYLANEKERETLAKASFEHLKKYHSDVARANYVLQMIKEKV